MPGHDGKTRLQLLAQCALEMCVYHKLGELMSAMCALEPLARQLSLEEEWRVLRYETFMYAYNNGGNGRFVVEKAAGWR